MNVYDFDRTIFCTDSSYAFVRFCLRKYPCRVLKCSAGIIGMGIKKLFHRADTKQLKEKIFAFLPLLPDAGQTVSEFWAENLSGLGQWYISQRREDDLIISASPDFLVRPAAEYLGAALIATTMDIKSGKIDGLNCHDREKVRRFYEAYPEGRAEEFYSDSRSDAPMAEISERAFLVNRGVILPWPGKQTYQRK